MLRTLPILERMRPIEGWLSDEEADLLIAGVDRALHERPDDHAVVEAGAFCGRATTVLACVTRERRPRARVHSIDAHDGLVGALDEQVLHKPPTLARLQHTLVATGLTDHVVVVQRHPHEAPWHDPIAFLLIDGLHDYPSVSRDFWHFEPWLPQGAYVAFHDYADYYPGVTVFVDELLATGAYALVARVDSLILLRRKEAPT
jgi:hypothetical protein